MEETEMKKTWFAIMLFLAAAVVLSAGQVFAIQIDGHDYELLEDVNPVGAPTYVISSGVTMLPAAIGTCAGPVMPMSTRAPIIFSSAISL
jgi:hypothetical protein